MTGKSAETQLAVMDIRMKNTEEKVARIDNVVASLDDRVDRVLQFVAAQEQRDENAKSERERIFKASTLLPVAILTSVISVSVQYMFNAKPAEPTKSPDPAVYVLPSRPGDHKQVNTLKLDDKSDS